MTQPIAVRVPDLGDYKDVEIIEVAVKPGDPVAVDATLLTLETEKATMDVPSTAAGIVREITGPVAAHHGLMRQHLNFLGREVPAAQECDAMVRAELRGRQVYTRMAAHQYERGQGDGLQAVVAYPSRNSFPGSYPMLIRRLDYVRIANLRYYTRRIGLARIWGRPIDRFGKLLAGVPRRMTSALAMLSEGRGIEIETTGKTPSDLEEALRQIREYQVLAFWKDAPYLKWRYEDHPEPVRVPRTSRPRCRRGARGHAGHRPPDRRLRAAPPEEGRATGGTPAPARGRALRLDGRPARRLLRARQRK